jgi:hypothetical protein
MRHGNSEELIIYPIKKYQPYHKFYNKKRKIIHEEEMRSRQQEKEKQHQQQQTATSGEQTSLANLASVAAAAMKLSEKDPIRKKKPRKSSHVVSIQDSNELLNESELEYDPETQQTTKGKGGVSLVKSQQAESKRNEEDEPGEVAVRDLEGARVNGGSTTLIYDSTDENENERGTFK